MGAKHVGPRVKSEAYITFFFWITAFGPIAVAGELEHAPEVGLIRRPAGLDVLWVIEIVLSAALTYFVWKVLPHVIERTRDVSRTWGLSSLGVASVPSWLWFRGIAAAVMDRRSFPRPRAYRGILRDARLTIRSGGRGTLTISDDSYDVSITESDPALALAKGDLICAGHGGNAAHFTLTRGKGRRANELLMRIDYGNPRSTMTLRLR